VIRFGNMRCTRGVRFFALFMLAQAACGEQSVSVLTPRDPRDGSADSAPDASVDAIEEGGTEPPEASSDNAAPADTSPDGVPDVRIDVAIDSSGDGAPDSSIDRSDVASDGASDGAGEGGGPTVGCLPLGMSCSFAGECCSLACPSIAPRVCASGPICTLSGVQCDNNADCCTNKCIGGNCEAVPAGVCRPAGELCSVAGDCCGGKCAATGGGSRCALLNECRVLSEVCAKNDDCCSRVCGSGPQGPSVCIVAPACDAPGNACRAQPGDRCTLNADCCSAPCGAGVDGVLRCGTTACRGECVKCSEDRECCTGMACVADGTGYLRCRTRPVQSPAAR
jgi:hypothetical protein